MKAYGGLCTEFYDADKEFAQSEELTLYQELFTKNDLLLEPMCGSERLLIPLSELGYTVHGFDLSACMLESCKQRAAKLNLLPILHQSDIENYPPDQKYQGIIIPLGSFQLLYPRENAYRGLGKLKQLLASGGKLVMDLFIPWEAMYENGDIDEIGRQVELTTPEEFIKINYHATINKFDQHMLSKTRYTKYAGDRMIAQEDEQIDILWYYPFEMELILEKYGFKNVRHVNRFINGGDHMTFIAKT